MLLRVSTNDTSPSTSSMIATSAGAPICSVPSLGARLITLAGLIVAMATTCSIVKPCARNLLMTQVRYGMHCVLPENTWTSDEMVSGGHPCAIAGSAPPEGKAPPPWAAAKEQPPWFGRRGRAG